MSDVEADEFIPEAPKSIGPYTFVKLLGVGAFAAVYEAKHTVTMVPVAVKVVSKQKLQQNPGEFELLQREVAIMKQLDFPFIVAFYEPLDDENNFYLVMELADEGTLLDLINRNQGMSDKQAKRLFYQLVLSLEYLHRHKRIAHRDLKAENVMLDKNGNIRLVDFGLSKGFSESQVFLLTTCGSPAYVAPEIIRESPYTTAADLWSAGVLLYAMVFGTLPFGGDNLPELLNEIVEKELVVPKHVSPELRDLLGRLMTKDPAQRIRLEDVKKHPWLAEFQGCALENLDGPLMKSFHMMDIEALDVQIVNEMKALGYETGSLLQELKAGQMNPRTAAYKMLKRARTTEELLHWQDTVKSSGPSSGGPGRKRPGPAVRGIRVRVNPA